MSERPVSLTTNLIWGGCSKVSTSDFWPLSIMNYRTMLRKPNCIFANRIRKTGVKNVDSLHLACAINAKCDYFLSVDNRILKYPTDAISLCNPIDFLKVWEELE